ncbi:MAG: class I SAM-dependent methyltransferase [Alphaproteobacteria bacterium]
MTARAGGSAGLAVADDLYGDPDLAQFYDLENGWAADFDHCRGLAAAGAAVLDLGCGTGLFAATLAAEQGCRAVGVDPAAAMLDIARGRPGGDRVRWIVGDARTLRLDERFDLVVLTGHAFQVFLTPDDRAAALGTIARHLAPGGRFVFDSRNPALGKWRGWTPDRSRRSIDHPRLGRVDAWNDVTEDAATGIVTYDSFYEIAATGRRLASRSQIAFPGRDEIATLVDDAGLAVESWLGDWTGAPWTPASPEIIPVGRLR